MKTLTAFVPARRGVKQIAALVFALLLTALSKGASPGAARPPFPMRQEAQGLTLHLTDARWRSMNNIGRAWKQGVFLHSADDVHGQGLAISLDLRAAASRHAGASNAAASHIGAPHWRDYLTSLEIFGPQGERALWGRWSETGSAMGGRGIDPRWDRATLELEALDPAAPVPLSMARGEFHQSLLFDSVPVPRAPRNEVALNRVLTTARGTRVILHRVVMRDAERDEESAGETGRLFLALRIVPSTAVPDLRAVLDRTGGKAVDDTGRVLTPYGYDFQDSSRPASRAQEQEALVAVPDPPSPRAKTFKCWLRVFEQAESLRDRRWLRRFRFTLSPRALPVVRPSKAMPPVRRIRADGVDVALDPLKLYGQTQYVARFWMRDRSKPPQAPREWELNAVRVRGRTAFKTEWEPSHTPFWKADGTPARRGERGQDAFIDPFDASLFSAKAGPIKLAMAIKIRPTRRRRHTVEFAGVLLPQPGQSLKPNVERKSPHGARLVLRDINLPDYRRAADAGRVSRLFRERQMSLTFEFLPAPGQAASRTQAARTRLEFACDQALNEWGHQLNVDSNLSELIGNIKPATASRGALWTLYLLPPAPQAKWLNVRVTADESVAAGKAQAIVLRDVPAPPLWRNS